MKQILKYSTFFLGIVWAGMAHADTAHIDLSQNIAREQCAVQRGAKLPVFQFVTVKDARPQPSVGTVKKGDTTTDVTLDQPVAELFKQAITTALTNCGYQFSTAKAPIKVSVDVVEFFAGNKKGLVKSETKASAHLAVHVVADLDQKDIDFSGDINDSGLRSGKLKQLQTTLQKILDQTVVQMVTSNTFADALKEITHE